MAAEAVRDAVPRRAAHAADGVGDVADATRTAHDENPARVEYELTELGRSALGPTDAACEWAVAHLPELAEAREAYERRP